MTINEMIKKFKLEIAYRDGEKGVMFGKKPSAQEIIELKSNKQGIMKELESRKELINEYFANLNNVEIYCLQYSHFYIDEKTEEYQEMKELDKNHFEDVKANWIKENRKYFVETSSENKPYEDTEIFYNYTKEKAKEIEIKIEEIKNTKEYQEKVNRFNELCDMAEKMKDIDFEDITGLRREDYINF